MGASRRALVGAAALLAFGAAACDALLGLGQYKDCNEGDCPDAGSDGPGSIDAADASDSAADVGAVFDEAGDVSNGSADAGDGGGGPLDASGTGDGSVSPVDRWARWLMPNPDASIGGDSSTLLPNPMAYDAGDGGLAATVYDTVTHLVWQQDGSGTAMSEPLAAAYCTKSSWEHAPADAYRARVARRLHADAGHRPALLPANGHGRYWSSSPVVAVDGGADAAVYYWTVDFSDGLVHHGRTMGANVRCVQEPSP